MGRLKRLLTKSWKVENKCRISSSETRNPSSTLTAMVKDNRWLSLRKGASIPAQGDARSGVRRAALAFTCRR